MLFTATFGIFYKAETVADIRIVKLEYQISCIILEKLCHTLTENCVVPGMIFITESQQKTEIVDATKRNALSKI